MRGAWWIGVLLLAAGLAGCVGGDDAAPTATDPGSDVTLSQPRFDVREPEIVRVESTVDGKQLHTVVYRPDTNETVPVFVNFSPYWGDSADERGDPFAQYVIERYVPRGYAVVLAAIRGTGHSEGCFQIAGDKELADMHDVIDRFAGADWSNGKVAAGGKSYDSTPQNGLVAKMPHPALEGIFHVSGITDMYRYTYKAGVPYTHGPIFNTYYYGQGIHEYGLPGGLGTGAPADASTPEDEDPDSIARAVDDAACTEFPEEQAHGVGSGLHGMKTGYWTERDWNRHVGGTDWNGSVFFVHGLQDWNVKPDHVLPWLDRLPDQVRVKGWLHQDVEDGTGHVYPMRADWNETMLRWLDHELKDAPVDVDWGFEAEGSDDVWRESDAWPPEDVDRRTVDVELSTASNTGGGPDATGSVLEAGDEPIRYAGRPQLTVTATSTSPDPVLSATLYEDAGDGELTWVNQAILRGPYRAGLESPDPVPVGEAVTYNLTFYPQDDVLEPGERWVLALGETPRFGVPTPAQLETVDYDLDSAELTLPIAPAGTASAEQPTDTPCFAC